MRGIVMDGRLAAIAAALLLLLSFGCAKPEACADDARACPDGSFAVRNASLGCDFNPCPQPPMEGGGVDGHGCIPSAGYSWCEPLQKCIRPWEEECSPADLQEVARGICRQQGVAQVSVCGPYIKSISGLDGAGSTFYAANGSEINCPLAAPDAMGEECRLLLFGNNCIEQPVCSPSKLRIMTEEFAPFNYMGSDGAVAGQSTDMVREILYRINETATIELMDWPPAYNISLSSASAMLYSVARTPDRESLFSWVGPVGSYEKVFYAREGTGLSITSLAQAKSAGKICVVKDSARHQLLSDSNISNVLLAQSDSECARELVFGKALLWLASSDGYARAAQEAGIEPGTFVQAYVADTTGLYLAFSKGVANETVQEWASALAAMKSDGTYKKILLKYSPSATAGSVVVQKLEGCKNVAGPGIDSICEIFHPSRIGSDAAVYYSIAHVTLAPGQKVSAHAMMNAEVVYVLNGQGTLSIDGKEYQVSRDYVVQIPASATQSLVNTGSVPLLYLAINSPPWEAERQAGR